MSLTLPQRIEAAVTTAEGLVAIIYALVNGGPTDTVTVDSGVLPSVAKKINDLGAAITTAFASGFIIIVPNAAGRAAAQAGQIGQMLWQKDTNLLYIANTTTVGDFSLHPLQTAISAPGAAVAALTTVVSSIQTWMALVDSNNDGVVTLAVDLQPITTAANPPADKIVVYAKNPLGTTGAQTITVPRFYELFGSLPSTLQVGSANALINPCRWHTQQSALSAITLSGRAAFWGVQNVAGSFGRGVASTGINMMAQAAIIQNNTNRPLPSFNPMGAKVVKILTGSQCSAMLMADGTICMAGPATTNVWDVFGSNSATAQNVFRTVFFNASGVNQAMTDFDMEGSTGGSAYSSMVSLDTSGGVWLLTSNQYTLAYSNSITGAIRVPLLLNTGVTGWSGKTAVKVRTDYSGSVFVLLNDGSLWAASGYNATGYLGLGSTSTLSNFTQINTGVTDFEIAGTYSGDYRALYVLIGTTLKGAGYNAQGQLGTGGTTNQSSFVTICTSVSRMRVAGDSTHTVILQKTDGTFWGCGCNTSGQLGTGATTNITTITSLTGLNTIVSAHGSPLAFCTSDIAGFGASAVVTPDGQGFTTGKNNYGQLGVGDTTDRSAWTQVMWTPISSDETLTGVEPSPVVSYPGFVWITSKGRILVAGYDQLTGVTSGIPGTLNANSTVLTPIRIPA